MRARQFLQLCRIRRVAGLDLSCFRQRQFFEQNALELQVGVHVELLASELLDGSLEQDHLCAELCVELFEIIAVDENSRMLHSGEHLHQRKLERGGEVPYPLSPEPLFDDRSKRSHRDRFSTCACFFVSCEGQRTLLSWFWLALLVRVNGHPQITHRGIAQRVA